MPSSSPLRLLRQLYTGLLYAEVLDLSPTLSKWMKLKCVFILVSTLASDLFSASSSASFSSSASLLILLRVFIFHQYFQVADKRLAILEGRSIWSTELCISDEV